MSNSLLPKKAPNVFNQETLERALVVLRQPFSIAVIASIAAHGLLWAALPNFLADQQKDPDTRRRVQVVELSPAEKAQLPTLGLNALPPTLLPAKQLPAQSGTKLPDPKLYNDPLFSSTPFWDPPPPTFPLSGLPRSIFDIPVPATKPPQPPSSPKPTPSPSATTGSQPTPTTQSSVSPTASPTAPARSATLTPEQIAESQQQGKRLLQRRELYTFNDPETTEGESSRILGANINSFAESAKSAHSDIDIEPFYTDAQKVIDFFPTDDCPLVLRRRNASFGALVKPDGTLAETKVLLTSGYRGLDIAAVEHIPNLVKSLVEQKKIGDDGKFKLIRFEFNFDPKSFCSK